VGEKTLLSKLLAAGLSSAVFLIWWPRHYPDAGLTWLVVRGVAWTATFELLLLAAAPLERRAWGRVAQRVDAVPRKVRLGGWLAAAGLALALVGLTAAAPPVEQRTAQAKPRLVKQVIVKRKVERVVVERTAPQPEVTAPAPVARPQAPSKPDPEPTPEPAPRDRQQSGGEAEPEAPAADEPAADAPAAP
jgi:hypothetical protein